MEVSRRESHNRDFLKINYINNADILVRPTLEGNMAWYKIPAGYDKNVFVPVVTACKILDNAQCAPFSQILWFKEEAVCKKFLRKTSTLAHTYTSTLMNKGKP